jgi:hypothetical protein
MATTTTETADEASDDQYVYRWRCEACSTISEFWYTTPESAQTARDNHVSDYDDCYKQRTRIQRWPRDEATDYSWPHFQLKVGETHYETDCSTYTTEGE